MLLRRITYHLKQQDWLAVGLDIIVVIVGIYLGMQASEWSEENKLNQASDEFIQLLIEDVDIAIEDTQARLDRQLRLFNSAKAFLGSYKTLASADELSPEQRYGLRFITFFTMPELKVGNIAKALSDEGSAIIRDAEARKALVDFQRVIGRSERIYERVLGRIKITEPILNNYRTFQIPVDPFQLDTVLYPMDFDLVKIQNSQQFEYAFKNALWGHSNGAITAKITIEYLQQLKSSLEQVIN